MSNRNTDRGKRPITGGLLCPHCGGPMQRYEHSPDWQPLPGRGYYTYWDRCIPCGHFQNYRGAHVDAAPEPREAA